MSFWSTCGGLKSKGLFLLWLIYPAFFWFEYSNSLFFAHLPILSCFSIFCFHIILWSLSFTPFSLSLPCFATYYPCESKGIWLLCIQTWIAPNRYIYSSTMIWVTGAQPVLHWNNQLWARMHTPPLMEMSHRQSFLSPITCHWACKIHSWRSHCSSVRLNGPSCVALSFRKMMSVIVKATFKSGVGEKIVPLFFTLLLAFHLVLILVMHDWLDWRNKLSLHFLQLFQLSLMVTLLVICTFAKSHYDGSSKK